MMRYLAIKVLEVSDHDVCHLLFRLSKGAILSQEVHNVEVIMPSKHRLKEESGAPIPLSRPPDPSMEAIVV